VYRAEVWKGSHLGKRIGKLLVGIHHFGFEHTVRADSGMRNVIVVGSCNRRSRSHRERPGRETEVIDFQTGAIPKADPSDEISQSNHAGITRRVTRSREKK
jgi:hypothetical protein